MKPSESLRRPGTDKETLHSYGKIYDLLLAGRETSRLPIFEIGVHEGGSLRAWADCFPGAVVHGIDIDPATMIHGEARIVTHLGNVRDIRLVARIAADHGPFGLIVDDGSHSIDDVLIAFSVLRNFVADEGIYVIEDIQDDKTLEFFRSWPNTVCFDRRSVKNRVDDILVVILVGGSAAAMDLRNRLVSAAAAPGFSESNALTGLADSGLGAV
jgi:hypothetical protein